MQNPDSERKRSSETLLSVSKKHKGCRNLSLCIISVQDKYAQLEMSICGTIQLLSTASVWLLVPGNARRGLAQGFARSPDPPSLIGLIARAGVPSQ